MILVMNDKYYEKLSSKKVFYRVVILQDDLLHNDTIHECKRGKNDITKKESVNGIIYNGICDTDNVSFQKSVKQTERIDNHFIFGILYCNNMSWILNRQKWRK